MIFFKLLKISFLQTCAFFIVPILLLFHVKDKRIVGLDLHDQRLPKIFKWLDDNKTPETGLNGSLAHQSEMLLGTRHYERPSLLQQCIVMTYDRELEHKGNPVPWWKIYYMRFMWLVLDKYEEEC